MQEAAARRPRPRWIGPVLGISAAIGILFVLAFMVRISEPRELPFPIFDSRAVFPDLDEEPAEDPDSAPPSRFEQTLQRTSAPAAAAEEPSAGRVVPLGGDLVADVPFDGAGWKWSSEGGATVIVHGQAETRPDALVYAEAFAETIALRPTSELQRFRTTVDPSGDGTSPWLGALFRTMRESSGLGSSGNWADRARGAQAIASRTLGRGLGFVARDEGFTGFRWVGRNGHQVSIRLARWEGSWSKQPPLAEEMGALLQGDSAPPVEELSRVPAYLIMGSAAEPSEISGVHLAILCARTPDCPVAPELADFLGSIRVERPELIKRLLREGSQEPFGRLTAAAGLAIQRSRSEESRREQSNQRGSAGVRDK